MQVHVTVEEYLLVYVARNVGRAGSEGRGQ